MTSRIAFKAYERLFIVFKLPAIFLYSQLSSFCNTVKTTV